VSDATGGGASRWKTFGERVIYDNPWVWLGQVDVELPDRERFWHHLVRLHRAAMMVLVDGQDRVLLLWRHRFVQDRWGWELPGGQGAGAHRGPALVGRVDRPGARQSQARRLRLESSTPGCSSWTRSHP
jgi:hypothetical protein